MTGYTTIKRNGGWTIELSNPIGIVNELIIQPVTLDHTVRWARSEIPSFLALISELTGIKESLLKQLTGTDSDRMFIAISFILPPQIKKDFEDGTRPLATPVELMTGAQKYEEIDSDVDELDPRFPKVNGPVKRFKQSTEETQVPVSMQAEDMDVAGTIDIGAPNNVMKKVG